MSASREEEVPLFETKEAKGRVVCKLLYLTIFPCIVLVWLYRLIYIPTRGKYAWIGMFLAELFFGLYWIITQSARWNVVLRLPFKDRLSHRYEDKLPEVDIVVCTADPVLEPPSMVIDTVLSVMSYNYPPEKLSVYLSDDGGSEFTFYALFEASEFSKYWIPFCKKFKVEPRSPQAYFAQNIDMSRPEFVQEFSNIKKIYENMKNRIDSAMEKGCISNEITGRHGGFSEWNSKVTKKDHQSIVQILIDGRNPNAVDIDGNKLPTLVYLSREKRPGCEHNFKAGSMNALIRVSSEISNAPIILNLDCDMYANDPDTIRDALCFFMDEKQGHQISYVQYPQRYSNVTKNDIYSNVAFATNKIELAGIDGFGGTLYCGTGCFHRRESISGNNYSKDHTFKLQNAKCKRSDRTVEELEEASKHLADCKYEKGTLWGKEMGLVYGCPVEDIVTGLTIQCRGWKPVYYNPSKHAFLGVVPTTLDVALVQFKRWSEGLFQIFFSKHCPFIYGHQKISLGAQMGYCVYLLWAPISLPTLYYTIIPALALVHNMPLFPQVSSLWFLPFAYAFIAKTIYSLVEDMLCGNTLKGWWNTQRMWVLRRTTSFLFAFIDTIVWQLGFSQTSFSLTAKVVDDDVLKRYEQEIIEFGTSSIMFTITSTIAVLNLFSLGWAIKNVAFNTSIWELDKFIPQMTICGLLALLYLPVFEAFFRKDKGRLPSSVVFKSIVIASIACCTPIC